MLGRLFRDVLHAGCQIVRAALGYVGQRTESSIVQETGLVFGHRRQFHQGNKLRVDGHGQLADETVQRIRQVAELAQLLDKVVDARDETGGAGQQILDVASVAAVEFRDLPK